MRKLVFFDLETSGREPGKHRIIQFAGIAADGATLAPVEELDVRIQLMRSDEWEPEALAGNVFAAVTGYKFFEGGCPPVDSGDEREPELRRFEYFLEHAKKWNAQAIHPDRALREVDAFLNRHKSVVVISKRTGKPYTVCRLAGHNVHAFDMPHMRAWYGTRFFPAEYRVLDTFHLAAWVAWMESGLENVALNLPALRERYGIKVQGDAHDALVDVRATLELARVLVATMGWHGPGNTYAEKTQK